jgi:outer membrane immunogenic protein
MLALAAATTAHAADIPRRPEVPTKAAYTPRLFDWSGFYVGLNGGWAWSRSQYDYSGLPDTSFKGSGWLVGGTAGYNAQVGQTVFGVEADLDWADIDGNANCAAVAGPCETKASWLGTVRGRLGYAADRFMPYVTGGAAFGKVKATVPGIGSASDTRIGWTLGAGVEYALTDRWSWKAEYLYVDLGKFDCGVSCGAVNTDVSFKSHVLRSGLNLRF